MEFVCQVNMFIWLYCSILMGYTPEISDLFAGFVARMFIFGRRDIVVKF